MVSVFLLASIVLVGWRVGTREVANIELQDDMKDLASQLGSRIGYDSQKSEEELRDSVIRKAEEHGIDLKPNQVTVRRTGSGKSSTIYVAADYSEPINIPFFPSAPFSLHFTPSGGSY
jgi:hypothetical protein